MTSKKVQCTVDKYTDFVISGLIGIKGTSKADVTSYILKAWIDQNAGLLKDFELSVPDWKERLAND